MSVLTLHFKDEIMFETGEPAGKTRNVEVIGAFVESNALIMGLSAEITAFVPLDQLTWASIYEGEVSSGSDAEAADEGEETDEAESSPATILKPNFGGGGNSDETDGGEASS